MPITGWYRFRLVSLFKTPYVAINAVPGNRYRILFWQTLFSLNLRPDLTLGPSPKEREAKQWFSIWLLCRHFKNNYSFGSKVNNKKYVFRWEEYLK